MNNKAVWAVVVVVIVIGAWYMMMPNGAQAPVDSSNTPAGTSDASGAPVTPGTQTNADAGSSAVGVDVNVGTSLAASATIKGYAFAPGTLKIKKGTAVTWTNQDSVKHSVVADSGKWTSDLLGQGGTYSHTFDTVGTFSYHCGPHPYMKGTVEVTE